MNSAFAIAGWGHYLPRNAVSSAALDAAHGMEDGWTHDQFGILSRHVASGDETSSMMGAAAAQKALDMAGWAHGEFDAIIGGCGVMEQPIPSTAALVQNRLGLGASGIPAFDVNQSCLSFMTALDVASMGMACGRWKRVLVFAADIASAGLDPANPKNRSIFGDGGAAVALEARDTGSTGQLASRIVTFGQHHALAQLRSGGTQLRVQEGYDALVAGSRFEMDAFGIFKAAAKALPSVIDGALADAGMTRDDLDCIVCHQASAPGVEHVRRLFAPREDRVVDIFASHGNQIATSVPTALAHALDSGAAKAGDRIMLLGTAAGISAGAMVLQL